MMENFVIFNEIFNYKKAYSFDNYKKISKQA